MKLPGREKAYISSSKLYDYLLSKTHSVGRWKARFFHALGFNETNGDILEQRLLSIAHFKDVKDVETSVHGMKYIIDGGLQSPTGSFVQIRTVWIIDTDQIYPRFVTAYPI